MRIKDDTHLKIKVVSLADEARRIRSEEKRWPGGSQERTSLYLHRIQDVRREARSALLAYGYLRGRAYKRLENKCITPPDWKRVAQLVKKYGEGQEFMPSWADAEPQKIAA